MISNRKLASLLVFSILVASAISVSLFYQPVNAENANSSGTSLSSQIQTLSKSLPVTLNLNNGNFPVYFNETGLPSGTAWGVSISGTTYSSVNTSIEISLPSGSYQYSVSNAIHSYVGNSAGTVSVSDASTEILLNYMGSLAPNGFFNLDNLSFVNSPGQLSTNQSVFPVYGLFDSFSSTVLLVGYSNSLIYSVNPNNFSQVSHFEGPSSPVAVSVNPHDGNIFVINSTSIFVYNSTGTLLSSKFLGDYLVSITYFPASNQIVVGNMHGTVEFLNVTTLHVDNILSQTSFFSSQIFAYNSNLGLLEVINDSSANGKVDFISGNDQVLYSINATGKLISILFNPSTGATYYTSYNGTTSSLYLLGSTDNRPISGTVNTYGLGFDPILNAVFATNTQNSSIVIVNATSSFTIYSIQDYGMPLMPVSIPGKSFTLIVNPINDALDIISFNNITSKVTFLENHLAGNTTWSVSMGSHTVVSNSDQISFFELPGEYTYSVSEVPGYLPLKGGTVNVDIQNVTVYLNFTEIYAVSFVENGLPSSTDWGVDVNGSTVYSNSGTTVLFYLPNGTYDFRVVGETGFVSSPQTGYFTVNGSSVTIPVYFSIATYNISFVSNGLPAGTTWSLLVNGITEKTDNTTLNYSALPGTYDFTVSSLPGYFPSSNASGTVTITDSAVTVNIKWLPNLYEVRFTENSLPSGTQWFVNLSDGTHFESSNQYIVAYLPEGQYGYNYSSVNSSWKGSSGVFTVTGSSTTIGLVFSPVTFQVLFHESGLPVGTEWNISTGTLNLPNITSNETSILLQNGTYVFTAYTSDSNFSSVNGTFTVSGSGITVPVYFSLLNYTVTFVESGLSAGTQWGVYVPGSGSYTSITNSLNISLQIGTYSFTPLPVNSYNSSSGSSFTLSDGNITIFVNYTYLAPPQKLYNITIYELGLPEGLYWSVDFNGSYQVAYPDGAFNFTAPNGTYNLEVAAVNHYGKIMPGSANITLKVHGSNQTVIVVFYGSYVWLIVDFSTSCFHNGHDGHNHRGDNRGDQPSEYFLADVRRF